ncbi:hypothetical protein AVEN_66414-1 [Araneus ventricosus]|uniref:Uncharacterized protein n=1 Tax=Araneus ventricosus TaxID=182803 RepID=A0A4Y2EHX1_ARAVE|nr:hypothetical protein AVEN_66414-1 [Araneus ventricosus]
MPVIPNELPLRHLFAHVDGTTTGPRSFTGEIGKSLAVCEKLPVVSFTPIECTLCEVTNKKDLNVENPSKALLALTTFIVKVYVPMLRKIKTKPSVNYGVQHLHQSIVPSDMRIFNLPAFDLRSTDYVDLIKWENVTELQLIERFSDDMIAEAIVNTAFIQEAILSTNKWFPATLKLQNE